jgi:hypothetical protein
MIRIRYEQLQALSDAKYQRFVDQMVRMLQNEFAAPCSRHGLRQEHLEPCVRTATMEATRWGMDLESDITTYIECIALLGPKFRSNSQHDRLARVLERPDISGSEKADMIVEYLIFSET